MTCDHCATLSHTYSTQCQQCQWRHIARGLKPHRVAWWRQQSEEIKEVVREYWLQVKAHDEQRAINEQSKNQIDASKI